MAEKMKTKSIQLPDSMWDFVDGIAQEQILSTSTVIRQFTSQGIRLALMNGIKKVTVDSIPTLKDLFYRELADYIKSFESLTFDSKDDLAGYFENHPERLEDAKKWINGAFAHLTDSELVGVLAVKTKDWKLRHFFYPQVPPNKKED